MAVVEFPNKGIPGPVSAREAWDAPEPNDRQVWGVCPYLRNLEKCKGCPPWFDDEQHGRCKKGCRALAEEACRIVMAAG